MFPKTVSSQPPTTRDMLPAGAPSPVCDTPQPPRFSKTVRLRVCSTDPASCPPDAVDPTCFLRHDRIPKDLRKEIEDRCVAEGLLNPGLSLNKAIGLCSAALSVAGTTRIDVASALEWAVVQFGDSVEWSGVKTWNGIGFVGKYRRLDNVVETPFRATEYARVHEGNREIVVRNVITGDVFTFCDLLPNMIRYQCFSAEHGKGIINIGTIVRFFCVDGKKKRMDTPVPSPVLARKAYA